jgi:hypothetical protein
MNVQDAQAAKKQLCKRIKLALQEFTLQTGLLVSDVNINFVRGPESGAGIYWVDADVQL